MVLASVWIFYNRVWRQTKHIKCLAVLRCSELLLHQCCLQGVFALGRWARAVNWTPGEKKRGMYVCFVFLFYGLCVVVCLFPVRHRLSSIHVSSILFSSSSPSLSLCLFLWMDMLDWHDWQTVLIWDWEESVETTKIWRESCRGGGRWRQREGGRNKDEGKYNKMCGISNEVKKWIVMEKLGAISTISTTPCGPPQPRWNLSSAPPLHIHTPSPRPHYLSQTRVT